jgi:uncharacterized membrane protein YecN with MAPEG domain
MVYTSLAALIAVFMTFSFSMRVGMMRHKHDIDAPTCTGNDEFERTFRGHLNQVEDMVLFLPVLFLSVSVIGDLYAGALGIIWCAGRLVYFLNYCKEASTRSKGLMFSFPVWIILAGASLWGVIRELI